MRPGDRTSLPRLARPPWLPLLPFPPLPVRSTREKHTGRSERGNLNNRTVLGRHRGVRGEGIKSQKCASVPAYQQFSKIYTCARAGVFMETAGTLVRWYTPLHSLFVNFL